MHVSVFSIICMVISAVISIGLPVALFIFAYKKYNAKFLPLVIGAAAFIIFVLILEQLVHSFVFKAFPLREKPFLYIIYGIAMAGIFEETARFISFKILLKRKYTGIQTSLSYGIGHGGIESVIIVGINIIAAIVISILINTGNSALLTGNLQGAALVQIETQIRTILTTPPYMFLLSGLERMFAIVIQIALSVIVFYSVFCKGKIWLYPLAILLHAIADISAAAYQVGIITNVFAVECLVGLCAILITLFSMAVHKKLKIEL